jgi:hypothetical protein
MNLARCLKKAQGKLSEENIAKIKEAFNEYAQFDANTAPMEAVEDVLDEAISDYNSFAESARTQGADIGDYVGPDDVQFSKKEKKPGANEITGDLDRVNKPAADAVREYISRQPYQEQKRINANLEKHKSTSWAAAAVKGMAYREMLLRIREGRDTANLEINEIWGKQDMGRTKIVRAFKAGDNAINKLVGSYDFIGGNRKAENDISTSFANCEPSKACAIHCYAANANARPNEIAKSEFTEMILDVYPEKAAEAIANAYLATPAGKAGLALRLNDKGDLSKNQVALIDELNKQDIRVQIFSKRPELLREVSEFNLRMLSTDATNFDIAVSNPDLDIAFTITDDTTQEMLEQINDRVAVYLPVNLKGKEWTKAELRQLYPDVFGGMTKKLCPVENSQKIKTKPNTSFVDIKDKTAEKGVWTCTACDLYGSAGCFHGERQTNQARATALAGIPIVVEDNFTSAKMEVESKLLELQQAGGLDGKQLEIILKTLTGSKSGITGNYERGRAGSSGSSDVDASRADDESGAGAGRDTGAARSADQSDADLLNTTLSNYGLPGENYEQVELPDTFSGIAEAFETAFDTEIVTVQRTDGEQGIFNGVRIKRNPGKIYVNTRSDVGFVNVAGHEFVHDLRAKRPDLYDFLVTNARAHFKDFDKYSSKINDNLQEGETALSEDKLEEELIADFVGDAMADPEFLEKLANDNRFKFRMLITNMITWLKGVANKLKGNKSEQYFEDVNAVRDYLQDVLVAYSSGKTVADVNGGTGPQFSRVTQEISSNDTSRQDDQPQFSRIIKEPEVVRSAVKDRLDSIRYWMQDKNIDLKRKQQEIESDPDASPITDSMNAYQKISIWESKAGEKLHNFDEGAVQPLMEMIADTGYTMEEVGNWLVARHAEEANAYLYSINPDMGTNPKRESLSGMTNAEAQKILDKHRANPDMQKVGNVLDRLQRENLDRAVNAGLMTPELRDTLTSTYQHYVPLKRSEAGDKSMWNRGQGFSIKGKESKLRKGNADLAPDQIVANALSQIENTIVRIEKNEIGKAIKELAEQNPDDGFWKVIDTPTKRETRQWKVKDPETGKMKTKTKVVEVPDTMIDPDNRLGVKVDGEQFYIEFDPNNERAMRLAAGLKNLQVSEMNTVFQVLSRVNRFLSSVNTTFNPEFVISNFFRDVQTAGYNMSDTDLKGIEMKVLKDIPGAMNGIRSALFGDSDAEWTNIWEDFRAAGGKTSWIDVHNDIGKYEKKLKTTAERIAQGKDPRSKIRKILDVVEDANIIIENAVRLAAYKHALELTGSKEKAAALAKDLTVNFNRKGAAGPAMNALYMFYNASIQGSVRLLQAMVHSKKGQKLAVSTIAFAVALDMLNRSLSGEDDDGQNSYDSLPDYVKHHNLIIMGEKEPIVKIPLPYGYNVLHAFGQAIAKMLQSDNVNGLDEAGAVALAAMNSFNPVGASTFMQTLAPTLADYPMMMAENKNFAGIPLRPEHTFDSRNPKPEYLMHWSSASEASKYMTKMLNDLTGGDSIEPGAINLSPAHIDLAYSQYLGGLGAFINRVTDFGAKVASDEEITRSDIPFVRKVTGFKNEYGVKARYYDWSKNVGYSKLKLKRFKGEDLTEARKEPESELVPLYNAVEKRLRKLRKSRKAAEKLGQTTRVEELDELIKKEMARFNKAYAERMFRD